MRQSLPSTAIVSDPQVQQTGIADLLAAQLSADGCYLVERDQLAAALQELELGSMQGGEAATSLKLGGLLKADALILLSLTESSQRESALKVVISDCLFGARLRAEFLALGKQTPENIASRCSRIVGETRRQFAGGVTHLIGVTMS